MKASSMGRHSAGFRKHGMLVSMLLIFAAMTLVTRWQTGGWAFISPENLSNLSQQVTQTGILAIGMTMVILIGGIDLSVGSVLAVSAVVLSLSAERLAGVGAAGPWIAMILALGAGGVFGAWNGAMVSRFKLLPFVVTLATLTIARGIALFVSGAQSVRVKADIFKIIGVQSLDKFCYNLIGQPEQVVPGAAFFPIFTIVFLAVVFLAWVVLARKRLRRNAEFGFKTSENFAANVVMVGAGFVIVGAIFASHQGIPIMVLIFAALAAIASFTLNNTVFGRHLYAIGGNREAARLSGVNVARCTFAVFTIMGFLAGVAGIVSTCRSQAASPATQGQLAELEAIAAVVVGGTSLMGGVGTIGGTIIGVLIIGIVVNGMILMALPNEVQLIFKGLLIMIAVMLDNKTKGTR